MQIRNSQIRYGAAAQWLHWIVVALIVTQFVLASQAEDATSPLRKLSILATHKSVGMTVLTLAVLRLIWRLVNPVPAAPSAMPRWQRIASVVAHWALYALILLTPLMGWMMSSFKNYPVSYFKLFTFPDLVAPNEALFEASKALHKVLAGSMFSVAVLHILAALKHHFVDKDDVLRRMLPIKLRSDKQ